MIQNSFIFIPGIGEKTEENLWRKSILTWEDLKKSNFLKFNRTKRKIIFDYLEKAEQALDKKSASFFANHLPQNEYWRLYKDFYNKAVFLDIETTGLSLYYDVITLIGTFDGRNINIFIKDNNLSDIVDYLRNYELLITFNGKLFDVPFIKKEFPEVRIPPIHIDLRFLLRSLKIKGSLKSIEEKIGITRDENIKRIDGREAAVLWSKFIKGDNESLKDLILYNINDTVNLMKIMNFCYQKKIESHILPKLTFKSGQQSLFRSLYEKKFYAKSVPNNFSIPSIKIKRLSEHLVVYANQDKLATIKKKKIKSIKIKIKSLIRKIKKAGQEPISVGIDLAGSEKKSSGLCILHNEKAFLSLVKDDEDIIKKVTEVKPAVISIDSPLSLPKDRCCANDSCECRKYGITRECERTLKKRGINVYPCLIKSMQNLTMRGIKLCRIFENMGYLVIESYPGAAQDILRFPRKRVNLRELEIDLMNMGIKPISHKEVITHDEIDALTSALVGYFYLAGLYEAVGDVDEGFLIIPDTKGEEEMICQ